MNYKQTSPEELIQELEKLKKENESLKSSYQAFKDECNQSVNTLRISEKMHRSLFEISFQGIVYQNRDGQILDANPAAQKILGLTLGQLQGMTSYDTGWRAIKEDGTNFPGEEHPAINSLKTGKITKDTMMGVFNPVDEKLHWILINTCPLFNEDENSPDMVYTVFDDVTERKQTEEALRESKTNMNAMINASDQLIILLSSDEKILEINETTVLRMGRSRESMIGLKIYDVLPPEVVAFRRPFIEQAISSGKPVTFEDHRADKWVLNSLYPIHDEKGKTVRLAVYCRDIAEHKHAEMEITRQNGLITALLDSIPDLIFFKDKKGIYLGCNPAFAEFVGKERIDIIGKTDYDLFDKETAAFFKYHDNKMLEEMQPRHNEEWITYPYGRKALVDTLKTPYMDAKGNLIGILGVSRDITIRQQAEEAMIERENLLQVAQKIAKMGSWHYDLITQKTVWSENYFHVLGVNSSDVVPDFNFFRNRIHPDDVHLLDQTNYLIMDNEEPASIELRLIMPDGTIKTIHDRIVPIIEAGKIIKLTGVVVDITEQKQLEEKLVESSTRLLLATRAGHVGIWDYDIVNNVLVWDNQMFALYGISKSQFGGAYEAWIAGLHPDFRAQGDTQIQMAINGEKEFDTEFKVLWPDGSVHDIRALAIVIRSSTGKPLRMIGTSWDITQQKKTEAEIKLKNEELLQLNAEKDKFFSIIAHDLKSPFNSIVGFSDLLIEKVDNNDYEGIKKFAEIILQSSERAVGLLMNLMDWARSQTGRMEFIPEYFELIDFVNDLTPLFDDIAGQKSITIIKDLPPNAIIFADQAMINTVLRNLISNAIKFTKPGGEIIISAIEKQTELIISVSDNGVGIPWDMTGKLFRIDENYTTSGTNNESGTGLGLILCKEFVEKHGGKIWVESVVENQPENKPGGSTFFFTIPGNPSAEFKQDTKKTDQGAASPAQVVSNPHELKILIVEDHKPSEMLMSFAVKLISNEIITVNTGIAAIEACHKHQDIDLILMDIFLAGMDGLESTRQIRLFNKQVVIIAQTSVASHGFREKVLAAGCNDYLTKPFKKEELLTLIQKHFR